MIGDRTDHARVAVVPRCSEGELREPAATLVVELQREVPMTKAPITASLVAIAILIGSVGSFAQSGGGGSGSGSGGGGGSAGGAASGPSAGSGSAAGSPNAGSAGAGTARVRGVPFRPANAGGVDYFRDAPHRAGD